MRCKRCNREGASLARLALHVDLDECEDGIELYGATALLCATCTEYIGDEIGRLMVAAEIQPTTEVQG